MNRIIKIEILIMFVICSIYVYVDYSFNSFNLWMNNTIKVSYSFNKNNSNDEIIKTVSDVADKMQLNIYYYVEGKNKYLYQFTNEKINEQTNIGKKKEIPYPDSYRKIEVMAINQLENYNLIRGTFIISGTPKEASDALGQIQDLTVHSKEIIKHENSEYGSIFIPLISISYLIILICVSISLKTKSKKIAVLHLEGVSKWEIVGLVTKKNILNGFQMWILIVIIYIFLMNYLGNCNYLLSYLKSMGLYFVIYALMIILLASFSIKDFNLENLKNMINDQVSIYLLSIMKFCIILILCVFLMDIGISYDKYQSQNQQLTYLDNLKNYYTYNTMDDGYFSESKVGGMNQVYDQLYRKTSDKYDGIITASITCTIAEKDCDNNDGIVVSPAYMQRFNINLNTNDDKVYVYQLAGANEVSQKQITDTYSLRTDEVEIQKINTDKIPIINQDYNIEILKPGYLIVLNDGLINNSNQVSENMFFFIQSYFIKLNNINDKKSFMSEVTKLELSEQIRNLISVKDNILKTIISLKNSIRTSIILSTIILLGFIINLLVINRLIVSLMNKKTALMVLEGYGIYEIYQKNFIINFIIYGAAIICSLYSKNVYDWKSYVIIMVMYITLFLWEIIILQFVHNNIISKTVKELIKGETW